MTKYPFCPRCGMLLFGKGEPGVYHGSIRFRTNTFTDSASGKETCFFCYSYKVKKKKGMNTVYSPFFTYYFCSKENQDFLYMDFEYDMYHEVLIQQIQENLKSGDLLYVKEKQIESDFKESCEKLYNTAVITNPYFIPELHDLVLQDRAKSKAMYEEQEKKRKQKDEETHKKLREQRVYEISRPKPKCPTCGSNNVHPISTGKRITGAVMMGVFSSSFGKSYECDDCKYKW